MQVRVLGQVEVVDARVGDVPLNGPTQRRLVAALALRRNDTDTWTDLACKVGGRNLTRDEWEQLGPRTIEYRATCEQYPVER